MKKNLLFTPGPTPIPPTVIAAMSQPIIHHRKEDFKFLFGKVLDGLKYAFQTKEEVCVITGSGTAGMEAAVCNLFSSGDHVVVANTGKLGKRWAEIARAFGLKVHEIIIEPGYTIGAERIEKSLLENKNIKGVFITHCETSTGVTNDVKTIADKIRAFSSALIIVDAISSLAGEELRMDDWGIDVVVSASQKGLMTPPGLSFIALNQRAQKFLGNNNLPKFYLNMEKAIEAQRNRLTPWTPATLLVVGLQKALEIIIEKGIETIWERNRNFSKQIRDNCVSMGLTVFANKPSNIITALKTPQGVKPSSLLKIMEEDFGIVLAGGQDMLREDIFRISNMGYIQQSEVGILIKCLGKAIKASSK
jgi:serine---pyruvate transaminase